MSEAALRGTSRESLAGAREALSTLIGTSGAVCAAELRAASDSLFQVSALLDREAGLRRALTDSARGDGDRAGLARAVLGDQVNDAALDLVVWCVRARWSGSRDLADALELLAVEAEVASAERAHRLDAVEDELFRTGRIVAAAPALRAALSDRSAPVERRAELIEGLLDGRTAEETRRLVRQAVVNPRGRSFDRILTEYARVAADRRSRLVAKVTATVPLTEHQRGRLGAALARIYGHDVHLNVEIDPEVVGGIRVEIGDEVIDGTVLHRLDDTRRRLVG